MCIRDSHIDGVRVDDRHGRAVHDPFGPDLELVARLALVVEGDDEGLSLIRI